MASFALASLRQEVDATSAPALVRPDSALPAYCFDSHGNLAQSVGTAHTHNSSTATPEIELAADHHDAVAASKQQPSTDASNAAALQRGDSSVPPSTSTTSSPDKSLVEAQALTFRQSIKIMVTTDIIVFAYLFLILLLYFGGSYNPTKYYNRVDVQALIFDSPPPSAGLSVGALFQQLITSSAAPPYNLDFITQLPADCASFSSSDDDCAQQVAAETVNSGARWASIVVSPNVTLLWLNALDQALNHNNSAAIASMPPSVITLYIASARNSFFYGNYLTSQIQPIMGETSGIFSSRAVATIVASAVASPSSAIAYLALGPLQQDALSNPASFSIVDLHPAQPFVSTIATTLGLVFIWIISAAVVGTTIATTSPLIPFLSSEYLVLIRLLNTFLMTLACSGIFVGLLQWWAQDVYSNETMGILWMFYWLAMSTFANFNVFFSLNLGVVADLTGVLFLFLNVVAGSNQLPVQMENQFYSVGIALPFYNAVVGSRLILMGAFQDEIGRSVGILLAWFVLAGFFNFFVDRKKMNAQREQLKKAESKQL